MTVDAMERRMDAFEAKLDSLTEKVSEIREMLAEERGRRKGAYALATILGTIGGVVASFVVRR